MNTVNLIGRLTKDPDVRYSQGEKQTAIARFTLAVNRKYKQNGQPDAEFISCLAFGKTAELIEKYIHKGNQLAVTGHIQTSNYTNKDGQKVYQTDVIVDSMDFVGSKSDGSSDNYSSPAPDSKSNDGFMSIPEGDIGELPFA